MKTKKTSEVSDTSFEDMREGFSGTNQAANEAQAEATTSNKTGVAKRLTKRATKASIGSAKLKAPKTHRVNNASIADNVASGEQMVNVLESFGPDYNPINAAHAPVSLTARNVAGRGMIDDVRETHQQKSDDGNERRAIFKDINKNFSRVFNQLVACGAPEGTINNAKTILDQMRSVRKGTPAPGANTRSISQRSFFNMVEHVSDFLVLLRNCPEYDSNVPELKLTALEDYRDALTDHNASASKSKAYWDTSMVDRNKFFNEKHIGYVDTFQATKRSVKAIFGADSPQYHQVAHFEFRRIRD